MYVAASPRGEQLPPPQGPTRELPSLAMADATGDTSKQLETSGNAPVSWTGCALDFARRHVHVAARARSPRSTSTWPGSQVARGRGLHHRLSSDAKTARRLTHSLRGLSGFVEPLQRLRRRQRF